MRCYGAVARPSGRAYYRAALTSTDPCETSTTMNFLLHISLPCELTEHGYTVMSEDRWIARTTFMAHRRSLETQDFNRPTRNNLSIRRLLSTRDSGRS